jgi:type II secretion system protein N
MRLGRVALAAALFMAVLAFMFPTDALVRHVAARVTPPGGIRLEFAHAALRPWGLRLDGLSLRNPDGSIVAAAEWLLVRPSLWGLVRDRTGRPWQVTGGLCGGSFEAVLTGDGAASTVTLGWRDIELAGCALVPLGGGALEGRADGTALVRLARDTPLNGEGNASVRSATVHMAGLGLPLDVLHTDPASVRWALVEDKITLPTIALEGPELKVNGSGTIHLKERFVDSPLNLRLIVTPGPDAPPRLLDALTHLPPASGVPGARLLLVVGTITELRRLI